MPRSIEVCDITVRINFDSDLFGFLPDNNTKLQLIRNILSTVVFNGIIFLTNGFSLSIIADKQFYYIVDSHSGDTLGRPSPYGTGVILRFENVVELVNYIFDIYHYLGILLSMKSSL